MSALAVSAASCASHAGRVRRKNEDAYYADAPLFVVADGMGGALAGEVASRLTIQAFGELAESGSDALPEARLAETVRTANSRIKEAAASDASSAGMGSTVTAALLDGTSVVFAHVGDSRAYLFRDGTLRQLSEDHSLVAEMVRSGAIPPEAAVSHPQRAVITRALGAEWQVDVDTWRIEAQPGDTVMLCTDGLCGFVGDDLIAELVSAPSTDTAVSLLIDAANAAGGEDNVTVIVFRIATDDTPETDVSPLTVLQGGGQAEFDEAGSVTELAGLSAVTAPSASRLSAGGV